MQSTDFLGKLEREYTMSRINWNRSLTDIDMKRRKVDERERGRMQVRMLEKIASPTLNFELENFKLFGSLKRTETEIHNTMPSVETVNSEKEYIEFERLRKTQPNDAKFATILSSIQSEVNKPRTPKVPSGYAYSGIEVPSRAPSRNGPQFTVTPSRRSSLATIGTPHPFSRRASICKYRSGTPRMSIDMTGSLRSNSFLEVAEQIKQLNS